MTLSIGLFDLDELILSCRDDQAKSYISEAVACYRAGAHRSCIVASWIAVVFDVVQKLRDLDLLGDKQARQELEKYERIRERDDVKASLEFERSILTTITDLELITPLEKQDLMRLLEDRHRCAHPSMQTLDEPYQPTAELARYHLRNAVSCLLAKPPLQGKAALTRVLKDIESPFFPTEPANARERLEGGPLEHARDSLVRNLMIALTKSLLREDLSMSDQRRRLAALSATIGLYGPICEEVLRSRLPDLVYGVEDDKWARVVAYLRFAPVAWHAMGSADHVKANEFLNELIIDQHPTALSDALHVDQLKPLAVRRLNQLSLTDLASLVEREPSPLFIDSALGCFSGSKSFRDAEAAASRLLLPLVSFLDAEHMHSIAIAYVRNDQISGSFGVARTMADLVIQKQEQVKASGEDWRQAYKRTIFNDHAQPIRDALDKIDPNIGVPF
jgi:hypothetical protein